MDKIIRVLVFLFCLEVLYLAWQRPEIKELVGRLKRDYQLQPISIDFGKKQTFFEDWSEESILEVVNKSREEKSLSKLQINPKLNQAALVRLSVTLVDDYEGSRSGVTREKAVKNSGYSAKLVGDLVLLDFFKRNSPVEFWEKELVSKETLYNKDLKEVGIAVKNGVDRVSVYIILANPQKYLPVKVSPAVSNWGGQELWEAINKRRVERGVNSLNRKDELCTIASIRLNQLLDLGKLDGHEGFSPVLQRADLKWISDKYDVSEYLAHGYPTPLETVNGWENTMGHKSLLTGGEFVWGCVYAQNTFAVAITGY